MLVTEDLLNEAKGGGPGDRRPKSNIREETLRGSPFISTQLARSGALCHTMEFILFA